MAVLASIIFTGAAHAYIADVVRGDNIETLHAVASLLSYYGPTAIPAAGAGEALERLSEVMNSLLMAMPADDANANALGDAVDLFLESRGRS